MALKSKQQGLNILELMSVLTIAAIVLAIGVPSLTTTIARYNVKAEANRIVASINFARSQAVNKQQSIILERKSISNNDWSEGWTIFNDSNNSGESSIQAGDILLRDITTNSTGLSLRANNAGDNYIYFDLNGRLQDTGDIVIAICTNDNTDGIDGSQVTIANGIGRVTLSTIDAADKAADC